MSESFNTKSLEVEQLLKRLKNSTASEIAAGSAGEKKNVFRATGQNGADLYKMQPGGYAPSARGIKESGAQGKTGSAIDPDEVLKAVVESAGSTAFIELGDELPEEDKVRFEPPRSN